MNNGNIRVGLLGIELAIIDVASVRTGRVDTYQRYAEAVNRLDLQPDAEAEETPRAGIEGTATTVTVIEGELDLDPQPEAEAEGTPRAAIEGTATTVIEGELDRPAERVEQLIERVTGGWGFEKVTGGWGFEKVTGGGDEDEDRDEDRGVPDEQLVEKATGGGDEDRDQDRGVPASRRAPSRG